MLWLLGFILGISSSSYILLNILWRYHIQKYLKNPLPKKKRAPPLPKEVLDQLKEFALFTVDSEKEIEQQEEEESLTESCLWINEIIIWIFKNMYNSPAFRKELYEGPLNDSLLDFNRTKFAYILKESKITKIIYGKSLPKISNICTRDGIDFGIKGATIIKLNLEYDGGAGAIINLKTIFGINFWIKDIMKNLKGTMIIVLWGKILYYGFAKIDNIKMDFKISIGTFELTLLQLICSKILFPLKFIYKHSLPKMKSKWIFDKPEI